jgi:hypothetical protein
MPRTPSRDVYLQLPDGQDRDALRACLLAMQCTLVNLPAPGAARSAELQRMATQPDAVVFLDQSNHLPIVTHRFDHILKTWPRALRARTVLTRLAAGHVSQADRAWVKSLGFADLVASFDDTSANSDLRQVLDLVASTLSLPALTDGSLDRWLRAAAASTSLLTPYALIRTRTGRDALALADLLQFQLDIRDRSYRLKTYPACFVAAQAVQWLVKQFKLSPYEAVEVGRALQALGLLYHVAHQRDFADGNLFFRLRAPAQLPGVNIIHALLTLRERLEVVDRTYRRKTYAGCWVGKDAVDALCAKLSVTRHESQLILHRLMQFGYFEHVVREYGFIDGNYFYRFTNG